MILWGYPVVPDMRQWIPISAIWNMFFVDYMSVDHAVDNLSFFIYNCKPPVTEDPTL